MNYMQIDKASISNGKGFRVVLYCAGCSLKCEGCFNPETWDFNAGMHFDKDATNDIFKLLDKPYIKGITLSGGHPLESHNLIGVYNLIHSIKKNLPQKDIWLYTGLTLSVDDFDLSSQNQLLYDLKKHVISMCDVIVDGPYIESQRDITLPFRGSKNQRIIDVQKTLQQNEIVLLDI